MKGQIKKEIAERLQWAAGVFSRSNVSKDKIQRLNTMFAPTLKAMVAGEMTPAKAQRIRNMLGVYKKTVLELTK